MNEIETAILNYLRDEVLIDIEQITLEQNLLATGHIDSFSFIEMIGFLEKNFHIQFSDDDIQKPEITTVTGIAGMIAQHRKKAASACHQA